MKLIKLLFCLVLTAATSWAGGVKKETVPADSKFLVHLDLDAFRSSQVGAYVFKEFLQKPLSDFQAMVNIDVAAEIYQKISGITAYGNEFTENAQNTTVVLVNANAEAQASLEKLFELIQTYDSNAIQKEQKDQTSFYTLNGTTHIALSADKPWVICNSRSRADSAVALLKGEGKSLTSLPEVAAGSVAQVFALKLADIPNVPDQAKAVQEKIDVGTLSLSETAGQLALDLIMKAKSADASTQLKQMMDGFVGMIALSQPNNADLQELVKATKTSEANQSVNVKVNYPISKVFALLNAVPRQ